MGFEYYNVVECLRAANNDAELAVEFVMNGIPRDEDNEEDEMEEEEEQMIVEPIENRMNTRVLSDEEGLREILVYLTL